MGRGVGCGAKEIFWQFLKSYVHASIPVNIRVSRVICSFLKATKYQALVQSGRAAVLKKYSLGSIVTARL